MIITVHAKPNARENRVEWLDETTVKIHVTAAPEQGKATEAIRDQLAEALGVSKSRIALIRGKTTRIKQFSVA